MAPHYTLRQLRAALAVRQCSSFRGAAEKLHISQPALSLAVAELERQLGMVLFDRTSRSVVTTAAGEEFLSQADQRVLELDRLVTGVIEGTRSRRGRVVLGCLASVASRLMPSALIECARRYPGIEVVVGDDVAVRLPELVRQRLVDVAITMQPRGRAPDLRFGSFMTDDFALVCPADHPIARLPVVRWKDLNGQTLLAFSRTGGSEPLIQARLARERVRPAKTLAVSQIATMHALIIAGLGIAVLPRLAWPADDRDGLLVRALEGPLLKREIGVLSLRQQTLSPAAQGLVEIIVSAARNLDTGGWNGRKLR